jgi:hypothetical protein
MLKFREPGASNAFTQRAFEQRHAAGQKDLRRGTSRPRATGSSYRIAEADAKGNLNRARLAVKDASQGALKGRRQRRAPSSGARLRRVSIASAAL